MIGMGKMPPPSSEFCDAKKRLKELTKKTPNGSSKNVQQNPLTNHLPISLGQWCQLQGSMDRFKGGVFQKTMVFFTGRNRLQGPVNLPFDLDQSGMIGESTWRASKEFVSLTCCKSRKVPATIALRRTPCRKSTSGFPANISDCMFCGIWSTPES